MKRSIIAAAVVVAAISTSILSPTVFAADVGVSVSIGQPGFYGRLDIGGYPQPRLIYSQPRIVERIYVNRDPIYMHVPPGHAKNWRKHCNKYNACGERVYFVRDNWYSNEYAPRYQAKHSSRGNGNGYSGDHGSKGHEMRGKDHRGGDKHGKGNGRNKD